jgi:transcriptional regulator with XRE-family HTH domain
MSHTGVHQNTLLGAKIRSLREARGLTQNELAEHAEVSVKHLGEVERGRGNPSLSSLQKLAGALGISLGELFVFEQEGKSDAMMVEEICRRLRTAKQDIIRFIYRALQS